MIKMYYGDGDAQYYGEGVENYTWETKLGKAGSEFLNNLKIGKEKEPGTEVLRIFCYEDGFDLRFTKEGIKKVENFFNEHIFNLLPKEIRDVWVSKKPNLDAEIQYRKYDLPEIDLCLTWKEDDDWKYYSVCTICYEVVVK